MPKRSRESQPVSSAGSANPSQQPPTRKKTRVQGPETNPAERAAPAVQRAEQQQQQPAKPRPTSEPKKRPVLPGRVKRLAVPKPISLAVRRSGSGSTKPDVNRRGNKINKGWGTGGFDAGVPLAGDVGVSVASKSDAKGKGKAKEPEGDQTTSSKTGAELWITRKTSYPAYLRAGVATFIEKGHHTLTLRALGAAIPVCLSLAMAIRDGLPCGDDGSDLQVRTGSVDVNDEVIPENDSEGEDLDIQYQIRTKSSVECVLSLKKNVRNRLLVRSSGVSLNKTLGAREMGVRPGRGGRGKPIRGGSRGGRGARGSARGRGE